MRNSTGKRGLLVDSWGLEVAGKGPLSRHGRNPAGVIAQGLGGGVWGQYGAAKITKNFKVWTTSNRELDQSGQDDDAQQGHNGQQHRNDNAYDACALTGVDAGQVLNVGTAIGTAGVGGGNTAVTVARGCATGVEAGVSGVLNNNTTGNRDAVLGTVQAHAVQRAVGEISGEAAKPVAAAACGKSQRVAMATDVRNSAASNWMQILDEKVPELQEAAQQLDIAAKQQPIQQAQAEIARQSDIIRDADAEITKLTANTS